MIDQTTVNQILDTADIVDVVSDFVSLRKRGSNWVGLCPFHNDRKPSFNVSRVKGIYKCFSCGEGGSAVNFIMKHEQMTYVEALKYLAAKYHIEVKERELTDEERTAQTERESMLVLNEWACQFFEDQLWNTTEGQEVGLSYFRRRGFSDATIRKFRLGYSPESRTALYSAATRQGYSRDLLLKLGLCKDDNHGGAFDFFRSRVMFPIFNIAGKVIAFGGRTLKKTEPAKYFNSPDSPVYNKSSTTMYGLYQAKRAIAKLEKCFIVEGYADVISMHQAGFENVIASSGTALTEGHIHLLHRFTDNVTELFDGDAAGIHAALRGIDMLLREGLNIKVLLLPDGEDPDSYAQSHSLSQVEQFIAENEQDFIRFKTGIVLADAGTDPVKRAKAIDDVVGSIAVIPSEITRAVYVQECAALFGIQEDVLLRELQKRMRRLRDEEYKRRQREQARQQDTQAAPAQIQQTTTPPATGTTPPPPSQPPVPAPAIVRRPTQVRLTDIVRQERDVIMYVVKYGMCYLCDTAYDDGTQQPTTVTEFIQSEMEIDQIELSEPLHKRIFDIATAMVQPFYHDLEAYKRDTEAWKQDELRSRLQNLDPTGLTSNDLQTREQEITAAVEQQVAQRIDLYRQCYLEKRLTSHPDDDVRDLATDLVTEKHQLSKIYTQNGYVATEFDRLFTLVPKAINAWKNAVIADKIRSLQAQMQHSGSTAESAQLLQRLQELFRVRSELAKLIGDRVVNPK